MNSRRLFGCATAFLLCVVGCGGADDDDSGGGTPVCGLTSGSQGLVLTAAETNDYKFVSTLMLDETLVAPRSNVSFDWSAVTTDFIHHAVDPMASVDMVAVIVWKLSAAELAIKLNADNLSQSDFESIAMVYTNKSITSAQLFNFTSFGYPIPMSTLQDYLDPTILDPATHTYTVMISAGTTPGKGTHMIKAFRPDPQSTNTMVALDTSSATLTYDVDLLSVQPVPVPVNEAGIVIDWSNMQLNALGSEFDPTAITEVAVGRFTQTMQQVQDQFLDIDLIADQLFWGEVPSGASFMLSGAKTDAGVPFAGIDDTALWLVALRCGTCTNPAPWFLTQMQPCMPTAQAAQAPQQQTTTGP